MMIVAVSLPFLFLEIPMLMNFRIATLLVTASNFKAYNLNITNGAADNSAASVAISTTGQNNAFYACGIQYVKLCPCFHRALGADLFGSLLLLDNPKVFLESHTDWSIVGTRARFTRTWEVRL
jgi:hypothetical protein